MRRKWFTRLLLLVLLALSFPVVAHEAREVGVYAVELGWRVEPAYVGVYNGPEVFVHDGDGKGVTGLESTLSLMVHFGNQEKLLEFDPVDNDPGHYTADLIATRPGDYEFHLFGKIGDQDVDEAFTSADGKFGSVEPSTDILFPLPEAANGTSSLQAQIDDLKVQMQQLVGRQSP